VRDETGLKRARRPIANIDLAKRSAQVRTRLRWIRQQAIAGGSWVGRQPKKEFVMKMHLVMAAALAALCSHAAFARYDGGDTWSELQPQPITNSTDSLVVATTAKLSDLRKDNPSVYGAPAQPDSADRIVRLGPGAHWVNVDYGETVEFVAQAESGPERSFAWRFDVSPVDSDVDLSKVAPADFPVHDVHVFVAPDPRYTGE
jgi:hypothetical protein